MSNQTGFRQGRLGIGKNPIFPLDISGSTRIEGDLILGGTIADINGTPIEFGASSATLNVGTNMPIPEMTVSQVPSWEDSVTIEGAGKFVDAASAGDIYYNGGNIGIGTDTPTSNLHIKNDTNITSGDTVITGNNNGPAECLRLQGKNLNDPSPAAYDIASSNSTLNGQTYTASGTMGGYNKDDAFDGTFTGTSSSWITNQKYPNGTYTGSESTNGYTGEWIQVDIGQSVVLKRVNVHPRTAGEQHDPKNMRFFGSSDGTTWVQIKDWAGLTKANNWRPTGGPWTAVGADTFFIGRYFRLVINASIASPSYSDYSQIGELELKGILESENQAPTGTGSLLRFTNAHFDPNDGEYNLSAIAGYQGNAGGELAFYTAPASSDIVAKMVIDTAGNVGIGTTTPGDKLEVNGNINFTGTLKQNGVEFGGGKFEDAATSGDIYYNGGNVGIGTTSPQSGLDIHKMHVETGLYESDGITFTTESSAAHLSGTFWSLGYIGGYHLANNGTASGYPGGIVFKTKPANSTADYNLTTRMVIDAAGNVGIGTTSPNCKLDVTDSGSEGKIQINNDTLALLQLRQPTSDKVVNLEIGRTSGEFSIRNNSGEKIRMKENGNVGIGTTDPKAVLNISASQHQAFSYSGLLRLHQTPDGGSGIWGHITLPDTNTASGDADGGYYLIGRGQQYSDKCLTIHVPTAGSIDMCSTGSVRMMKIQGNGNVGIGTTSPRSKLHIASLTEGNVWTTGTTTADCHMLVGGYEWGGTNDTLKIGLGYFESNTSNVPMYIGCRIIASSHDTTSALVFATRNSAYDNTAAEERMCILPNGNVGIGTTDPQYKLDVYNNGSARLARFQTNGDSSIEISSTSPNSDYDDVGIVWHGHNSAPYWHLGVTDDEQWLCVGYQSNSTGSTGWGNSSESISFHYDGRIWYGGSWKGSDDRIKNNEKLVTNALDIINKLQTKKYFKSNKLYSAEHNYILNDDGIPIKDESGNDVTEKDYYIETGFIAQEVKKIPELAYCVTGEEMKYGKEYEIIYDENGNTIDDGTGHPKRKKVLGYHPKRLALTYQDIFCYNVTATQELHKENEALKKEVNELKTIVHALKNHLGLA